MRDPLKGEHAPRLAAGADPALFAVLGLGTALGLWRLGLPELDIDEALTALIAEGRLSDLSRSVAREATPPLYFLLLWLWETLAGPSVFALRSLSVLTGLAAVTATYWATRCLSSRAAARWAALLLVVSPLWLFRARDVRMYALVALLSALAFGLLHRAASERRTRDWLLLGLVLTAGCYAHNYGLFLLAACAACIAHSRYRAAWRPLFITLAVVTLLWLPWLPNVLAQAGSGSHDWIAGFWQALPPAAAIPKSFVAFLPGGFYPVVMRPMPSHTSPLAVLPIALAIAGGIGAASAVRSHRDGHSGASLLLLCSFLFVPLLLAWLYSALLRPIYLVGRYDIVALPAFCALLGWGLSRCVAAVDERWRSAVEVSGVVLLLGLAATTLVPYYRDLADPRFHQAQRSADFLAPKLRSDDAIVYTGLRRAPLEYALRRRGALPGSQRFFPREIESHPGWMSERRMSSRSDELMREAAETVARIEADSAAGRRTWLVLGSSTPWDQELMRLVSQQLEIDYEESSGDLGLACVTPPTLSRAP